VRDADLAGDGIARPRGIGDEGAGQLQILALTPLIWEHVNPYGRFELDMTTRLPLQ